MNNPSHPQLTFSLKINETHNKKESFSCSRQGVLGEFIRVIFASY
jgi:hypothetical protein